MSHTTEPKIGDTVSVLFEGVSIVGMVIGHDKKDGMPIFDYEYDHKYKTASGEIATVKAVKWAWLRQIVKPLPAPEIPVQSSVDNPVRPGPVIYEFGTAPKATALGYILETLTHGDEAMVLAKFQNQDVILVKGASLFGKDTEYEFGVFKRPKNMQAVEMKKQISSDAAAVRYARNSTFLPDARVTGFLTDADIGRFCVGTLHGADQKPGGEFVRFEAVGLDNRNGYELVKTAEGVAYVIVAYADYAKERGISHLQEHMRINADFYADRLKTTWKL